MLADKGYDSDAVRDDIEEHGGAAMIPTRATREVQRLVDKVIYALRNRIERFFSKITNSRHVATRSTSSSRASRLWSSRHNSHLDRICPRVLVVITEAWYPCQTAPSLAPPTLSGDDIACEPCYRVTPNINGGNHVTRSLSIGAFSLALTSGAPVFAQV